MVVFEFAVYLRTRLAAYCAIVRPPIELLRVSYVRYKIIQGVYKSQSDECDERNSKKTRHLNWLNPFYKYQVACAREAAEFKDSLWLISFKNCNAFISNDEHCLWLCGLLKSNKDVNGLLKTKIGLLLAICKSAACFSFSFLPLIIGVYIVIKELPV